MAVKHIKLPETAEIVLSCATAEKLMDIRDSRAALLYIYILRCRGELDLEKAAVRLAMTAEDVSAGYDILARVGLVADAERPIPERADETPEYSAADVSAAIESDDSFRYVLDFTQQRLGKMLSSVDTQTLLGIYSWIGLPADVICLLVTYSIDSARKKFGAGRNPTLRSIEKTARVWHNMGILTYEQAESYLKELDRRGSAAASLARLLHIDGRMTSPTETKYIEEWIISEIPEELILKAYDITVVNKGKLIWSYMNAILQNWQKQGFRTVDEVLKGDKKKSREETHSKQEKMLAEEAMRRLREANRNRGQTK